MALTTFVAGQVLQAQQLNDSYAAVDWNENVIINGAMQVAQRGTSTASITTSGYYTADRWNTFNSSLGTWTQSVENDAPTGSGFRKSVKMLCTTADASPAVSDNLGFQQRFEGQNVQLFRKGTASATTFVFSFWVKSNVTGTYIVELLDNDNTRSVSASYTINASGTWEQKIITLPADTTGALDNDNEASLYATFWLAAGTNFTSGTLATNWAATVNANRAVGQTNIASAINNYWQVTGVQLQPSRESQFLFQDYGTVLAQCQRYFWRSTSIAADSWVSSGVCYSTQQAYTGIYNPVPSRSTSPTYSASSATAMEVLTNGAVVQSTVIAFSEPNGLTAQLIVDVASGLTAGGGASIRFRNTNDYYQMNNEM